MDDYEQLCEGNLATLLNKQDEKYKKFKIALRKSLSTSTMMILICKA